MNNQNTISEIQAQCAAWRDAGQMKIAHAEVRAVRNDRTHEIEVRGHFYCAPDEHTILLYPINVYRWGYWNKTQIRKQMSEVKRELLAEMVRHGYTAKMLNEPLEMCEIRF